MDDLAGPYRGAPPAAPERGDDSAREAISAALVPGERLLWAGRPRRGARLRIGRSALSLALLVATGLVYKWESGRFPADWPMIFTGMAAALALAGLYFAAGHDALLGYVRRRHVYGVTDRRALIVLDGKPGPPLSIDLDRPDDIDLEEDSDGTGDIVFGRTGGDPFVGDAAGLFDLRRGAFAAPAPDKPPPMVVHRFKSIPDAALVFERIRESQREIRKQVAASVIRG